MLIQWKMFYFECWNTYNNRGPTTVEDKLGLEVVMILMISYEYWITGNGKGLTTEGTGIKE